MNAPIDPSKLALTQESYRLDDKYTADEGTQFLTGTQALVRLPMVQRRRDLRAGLNTAGYITGYRGSPLGSYDQLLFKSKKLLDEHHLKFEPGLNEDLAATALWGTQQTNLFPGAKYDGVFGIWYGKNPGVDRCGDVFRHANQAGTWQHGGVLALSGDDIAAKSSTVAAQTDFIFSAVSIPVFAPASIQDYLDYGLHGLALSRMAGVWAALRCVTDSVESGAVVEVDPDRPRILLPIAGTDYEMPTTGLGVRWPEQTFPQIEERLVRYKLPAVSAYQRANRLDQQLIGDSQARFGIVTTGKAYLDVRQALADLGISQAVAKQIGLSVYKVAMPWPLDLDSAAQFIRGQQETLLVEEKRSLVEAQLKEGLFGRANMPLIVGKRDETGAVLFPEYGELSPALVARIIAQRLARFELPDDVRARMATRIMQLDATEKGSGKHFETIARIPYFCSGCPHNTSTKVPEGSRALAGIGCHYMAQWMDRSTDTFTQMGGEGAAWIGQAPFTTTDHIFQNLGDGTYNHSGSLAIRHAVASKTNITYKILFNDAVAMTGGQLHEAELTPSKIAAQVLAEGIQKLVVVTDEPEKYPSGYFQAGTEVFHRRELDTVQRTLREIKGVSVLIYDQTCASEKRRRRKRGTFPDPQKRAFINTSVCEGCGDCGVKSNCVSIEPVETEFGRKRAINQSSCNKDFSCVEGFCPSFVTVEGGALKRGKVGAQMNSQVGANAGVQTPAQIAAELPEPSLPVLSTDDNYAMMITGIGGTGVITIGQILATAAHWEGKASTVLDMAGLAQKGGAVSSYVRIAADSSSLHVAKVQIAGADILIGCDLVVSSGRDVLTKLKRGGRAVINATPIPTADFTRNPDWKYPQLGMQSAIADALSDDQVAFVDATRIATALMGDAIATNLFMLGWAWQTGLVPVSSKAIERAIELNAVAIDLNKRAFAWGRRAAVNLDEVLALVDQPADNEPTNKVAIPVALRLSENLEQLIARRADDLNDYQNEAYSLRYQTLVAAVKSAELRVTPGAKTLVLTDAVARNAYKLMAYKDEYEVARLYTNGSFAAQLKNHFDGDYRLKFHLAPPLLAKKNAKGELQKSEYGAWVLPVFRVLAKMKGLRGSAFDLFGKTEERRMERLLIAEYFTSVEQILESLNQANLPAAVALASLPQDIRGFGHVKERHVKEALAKKVSLLQAFQSAGTSTVSIQALSRTKLVS
jgi:indolepyruvate ferredoxin oxidoreductase